MNVLSLFAGIGGMDLAASWAGIMNRKNRLQALGNAVVPHQVYPILQAIMDATR